MMKKENLLDELADSLGVYISDLHQKAYLPVAIQFILLYHDEYTLKAILSSLDYLYSKRKD